MRRLSVSPLKLIGTKNDVVWSQLRWLSIDHKNDVVFPTIEPSTDAESISQIVSEHFNPTHSGESSAQLHGVALSPHLLIQTLLRLNHSSRFTLALFRYSQTLPQNPISLLSYHILIDSLGRDRQFDDVWRIVAEMDRNAIPPTSLTFLVLVRRLIAAGQTREAVQAFHDIETLVEARSVSSRAKDFLFLLDTLCKYGRVKLAAEIFEPNKSEIVSVVGEEVYNAMIYGWCKIGMVEKAELLLAEMLGKGIEPSITTYNVYLHGISRRASVHPDDKFRRTFNSAERIFDQMRARGISPDVTSFSAMVHICSRARKPELALERLRAMRAEGLAPTVATYTEVVKCLCVRGRVEQAVEILLGEMSSCGIVPVAETYDGLFDVYRKRNDVDGAMILYQKAKTTAAPTAQTYNILIAMLSRLKKRKNFVWEVWEDMRKSGAGPHRETYAIAVHGFCAAQRWEEACNAFEEMVEAGHIPARETFYTLQRSMVQSDRSGCWRNLKEKLGSKFSDFYYKFECC